MATATAAFQVDAGGEETRRAVPFPLPTLSHAPRTGAPFVATLTSTLFALLLRSCSSPLSRAPPSPSAPSKGGRREVLPGHPINDALSAALENTRGSRPVVPRVRDRSDGDDGPPFPSRGKASLDHLGSSLDARARARGKPTVLTKVLGTRATSTARRHSRDRGRDSRAADRSD